MKTTQNTVLITGGSAGIGFEIAKLFDDKNNHVIIVGRNEERLKQAASQLKNVTALVCDVSKEEDVNNLVDKLTNDFPKLNVLINNAGKAGVYSIGVDTNGFKNAGEEMHTNYLSVIRLTEKLLPLLKKQPEAAIVNVTSVAAIIPSSKIPTYAASKAALHSFSQSLRYSLEEGTIKVFELMPPLVNTNFSQAIGGANGISPTVVAEDLIKAFETNTYEIHVGLTATVYKLYLSSPEEAFRLINPKRALVDSVEMAS